MPDISMCDNETCPIKEKCYRHTATPNKYRQSMATFKPDEKGNCDYYWPNNEQEDKWSVATDDAQSTEP